MSATETGSAKPGLGWWPKLVLWTLVLAFGVLYLGSVKRNPRVDALTPVTVPSVTAAPEVPPSPGAAVRDPGSQHAASTADPVSAADGVRAERTHTPAEDPEPVRAAESAAFADSLFSKEHAGEPPSISTKPVAESPREGSNVPAPPLSEAPGRMADGGAAPPETVGSGGPTPPAQPVPARPASSQELGVGYGARETQEDERARILMEYESMRRAAEEQMRQYWRYLGTPAPADLPYGHPGYGPGAYPAR